MDTRVKPEHDEQGGQKILSIVIPLKNGIHYILQQAQWCSFGQMFPWFGILFLKYDIC